MGKPKSFIEGTGTPAGTDIIVVGGPRGGKSLVAAVAVEKISAEQARRAFDVALAPDLPASPSAGGVDDRLWTAAVVAEDLGLAVEPVLQAFRGLVQPGEAVLVRGELVATEAGREKIRVALDALMLVSRQPVAVAAGKTTGTETLKVSRLWGAKRVLALRANGLEVICAVQKSENLMAGMDLVDAQPGLDGMWFYYGRLPRRRGHW
jgi:hypothetical protein